MARGLHSMNRHSHRLCPSHSPQVALSLFSGVMCTLLVAAQRGAASLTKVSSDGLNFDPPTWVKDHVDGASQDLIDYVFSHFTGILLASIVYFVAYLAWYVATVGVAAAVSACGDSAVECLLLQPSPICQDQEQPCGFPESDRTRFVALAAQSSSPRG